MNCNKERQLAPRRGVMFRSTGVAGLLLFVASGAAAATFNVNDSADTPDADRSDGVCADASGNCTLRAAIEQANAVAGMDTVNVPAGQYVIAAQASAGTLVIEDDLNLFGAGRESTIIDGVLGEEHGPNLMRVRTTQALILDYADNDVKAVRYGGLQRGPFIDDGPLALAQAMVFKYFTEEELYVLTLDEGILRYDAVTGQYLGHFLAPGAGGSTFLPIDLEWGHDGAAYIADFSPGGEILRYVDGEPAPTVFIAGSGLAQPTAVVLSFAGGAPQYLVGYANTGTVLRYDENGSLLGTVASGISGLRDMLLNGDSLLVASEDLDAILAYDADTGASQGFFVAPGAGGLDGPIALALDRQFDKTYDLYVTSSNSNQILVYDGQSGDFVRTLATGGTTNMNQVGPLLLRHHDDGPGVNLRDFTLTRGGAQDLHQNGGLMVDRGASTVATEIEVSLCKSSTYGGGIRNDGSLTLYRSTISGNRTQVGQFGMTATGGGIFNSGNLTVVDSLITENFSGKGGAIATARRPIPGIPTDPSPQTNITNTTMSGNSSSGQGGAVRAWEGVTRITSSTIAFNDTNPMGSQQEDPYGGGIYVGSDGTLHLASSIIAENTDNRAYSDPESSPDCYSVVEHNLTSFANNAISVINDNCWIEDTNQGNLFGIQYWNPDEQDESEKLDFDLLPLGDYGGPTLSHYLGPDSVAIDAHIYGSAVACEATDQRGDSPRPLDGDADGQAVCDIGAVEVQATTGTDGDGDGIADAVDLEPTVYSNDFSDEGLLGNTGGSIVDRGAQAVTVEDAEAEGAGILVSTDPAGLSGAPAVISACGGAILVELGPGESQVISCLLADAGGDQVRECSGSNFVDVTLTGSAESVYSSSVEYEWSSNAVALSPIDEAVTNGSFPVGISQVALEVSDDGISVFDYVTVTVQDNEPPVVTPPPPVFVETCGSSPIDLGEATAVDNCAGEVSAGPFTPADPTLAGKQEVVWVATDAAANFGSAVQEVVVGATGNTSCCPAGSNVILGNNGNNVINGTSGVDCIFGMGGQDTINGFGGNDIINGGPGNDIINGGDGDDLLQGGPGQDTISGGNGADAILCGDGDDTCSGGDGDDTITGGAGQDGAFGNAGNDTLVGGDGDDTLEGGDGDDRHFGSGLHDQCNDEEGINVFVQCENVPGEGEEDDGTLDATFVLQNQDAFGYCGEFSVNNPNPTTATDISITFEITGGQIYTAWNGSRDASTGIITMEPNQSWNQQLLPNETKVLMGFCVQHDPSAPLPDILSADADL